MDGFLWTVSYGRFPMDGLLLRDACTRLLEIERHRQVESMPALIHLQKAKRIFSHYVPA